MASTTTYPTSTTGIAVRKLIWVGPLTVVIAVLANLAIRAIAVAFFSVPDGFAFLQGPTVIGSTVVFLTLALVAFIVVGRFARRPVRVYRIVALIALLLSFLNPIMALTGQFPTPGMDATIFWTMIAMHVVTALITVGMLTCLAVKS